MNSGKQEHTPLNGNKHHCVGAQSDRDTLVSLLPGCLLGFKYTSKLVVHPHPRPSKPKRKPSWAVSLLIASVHKRVNECKMVKEGVSVRGYRQVMQSISAA